MSLIFLNSSGQEGSVGPTPPIGFVGSVAHPHEAAAGADPDGNETARCNRAAHRLLRAAVELSHLRDGQEVARVLHLLVRLAHEHPLWLGAP